MKNVRFLQFCSSPDLSHLRIVQNLQGKNDVNKIRDMLEKERQELQAEKRSLGNLQADYSHLRDEQNQLRVAYDRLSRDYADSLASHKQLKSDLNSLQLKHTEQSGQLIEYKEQLTSTVLEVEKAENRLEVNGLFFSLSLFV